MVEYALVLVFVVAIATFAFSGETRQSLINVMVKVVKDVTVFLSGGANSGSSSN